MTALYEAACRGMEEMTELLLDHGADYNVSGGKFETPMGAAHANGHIEIMDLLVKHGASLSPLPD